MEWGLALPPVTLPQAQGRTNELGAALPQGQPEPAQPAPPSGLDKAKGEQQRLRDTGSGISQISSKIQGTQFGQNHPTLSKILGGAAQGIATLGDAGLSAVAPSLAINLPGTAYHHRALENQADKQVAGGEANAEKEAHTANIQWGRLLKPENAVTARTSAGSRGYLQNWRRPISPMSRLKLSSLLNPQANSFLKHGRSRTRMEKGVEDWLKGLNRTPKPAKDQERPFRRHTMLSSSLG